MRSPHACRCRGRRSCVFITGTATTRGCGEGGGRNCPRQRISRRRRRRRHGAGGGPGRGDGDVGAGASAHPRRRRWQGARGWHQPRAYGRGARRRRRGVTIACKPPRPLCKHRTVDRTARPISFSLLLLGFLSSAPCPCRAGARPQRDLSRHACTPLGTAPHAGGCGASGRGKPTLTAEGWPPPCSVHPRPGHTSRAGCAHGRWGFTDLPPAVRRARGIPSPMGWSRLNVRRGGKSPESRWGRG